MSKSNLSEQRQLEEFLSQGLSDWWESIFTTNYLDGDKSCSYKDHRNSFLLSRLQLEAKLSIVVTFTISLFVCYVDSLTRGKLALLSLLVGGLAELGLVIFWMLCRTSVGRKYPQFIFLGLSWSILFTIQIGIAVLGDFEPQLNIWTLVFLTQATLVPVIWPFHLLSQVGVLICYFSIYTLVHPTLGFPFFYYVERGVYLFWTCLICNFSVFLYERLKKSEVKARIEVEAAQEKSERLLLNILPEKIVEQLKQQNTTIADSFDEVTVLFADLVGFTEFSSQISPTELVGLLNQIFSMFDELAAQYEVEKIKTIGDAYMVIAGLPTPRHDHAEALAEMALAMQEAVANFNRKTGYEIRIRIGMNTGPVVAGVIGLKKWAYDLWGDTVNTASRMESHGIPGEIQVTGVTFYRLKEQYSFEEREPIIIKGKGEVTTYLLKGKQ